MIFMLVIQYYYVVSLKLLMISTISRLRLDQLEALVNGARVPRLLALAPGLGTLNANSTALMLTFRNVQPWIQICPIGSNVGVSCSDFSIHFVWDTKENFFIRFMTYYEVSFDFVAQKNGRLEILVS